MKKIAFRIATLLFAAIFIVSAFPVNVIAEDTAPVKTPFYNVSCRYEKSTSRIKLEFRMKSEDVKKYSDCEIKLYALSVSQTLADIPELTPAVSGLKPSNRAAADVHVSGLSDRLSRYVFAMSTPDGMLCSEPIMPEVDSVRTELSFKGIESGSTTEVFESAAGTVVVDIDIDKLVSTGSGYLYPTTDHTYTFSSNYLDQIDKLMKRYRSDGRHMLLRLFSGEGKSELLSNSYTEQRAVYAYISFIYSRYRTEEYGGINGIILGNKKLTTAQNATEYANALYAAAAGLDDLDVLCPLIVPVGEIFDDTVAFLDAMPIFGGLKFSLMLESSSSPYGLDDAFFKEIEENDDAINSPLKPADYDSAHISVENISRLTRKLEKDYKNSIYPDIIYNWMPNASISGEAIAAAYAYSYYELYQRGNVDCFVLTPGEGAINSAMPTVKYINTDLREAYVDDRLVMQLFGIESWQVHFSRLDAEMLSELTVNQKSVESGALPRFLGTVNYFDFSSSSVMSNWYAGELCNGISSDNTSGVRSLNAKMTFDGERLPGSAFVLYNYRYSESFRYTDYIAIDLSIESESSDGVFRLTVTLGGKDFIYEYSANGLVPNRRRTLFLDVREFDASDTVDYLRLSLDSVNSSADTAELVLHSVKANSIRYDSRTLSEHIREERERLKSDGDIESGTIDINILLFPGVVLVLTAFVMVTISSRRRREKETSRSENEQNNR